MKVYHQSQKEILSDQDLAEAAKKNVNHFSALYEKYFDAIFLFIFKRTGDEEQTADLCQQTFLKAMINIRQYTFKGLPFSSWLYRIALNEINMYYRNTGKASTVTLKTADLKDIIEESGDEFHEEKIARLLKALSNLNESDMQLIALRFFDKKSFFEIAALYNITENNAKVKVYRIIDKLKKYF